MIDRVAKNCL